MESGGSPDRRSQSVILDSSMMAVDQGGWLVVGWRSWWEGWWVEMGERTVCRAGFVALE